MKRPHIAFVTLPHPPHVNPTLPVVSALVRRGYRVTYATSHKFSSRVAELGADVLLCPTFDVIRPSQDNVYPGNTGQNPFCAMAERMLPKLTDYFTKSRPDIIIYDYLALAARILAHRLRVPAIQTSPVFPQDRTTLAQQVPDIRFRDHIFRVGKQIDDFLVQHGIEESDFVFHRERLNIYFFPELLQPGGDVYGPTFLYAGRCPAEQPYYGDWQPPADDDKELVLVSTSTTYVRDPAYFRMCVDALRDLDRRVVLSVGDGIDMTSLMPLPADFEIVQRTAHIKILPYASLFICLGGVITQAEALYHGVPLLILTHGFLELEWQAENFATRGLGLHLRQSSMSTKSVREHVLRIARDDSIRRNVERAKQLVRREPGGEEVANRIEEILYARSDATLSG